eukprot:CAMPEP_0114612082 /NCGR_PEP_ID=MMETSP0168-20121206/4442_1 /TAXON_ID=95228 ORGANISM="Vannella sp., Strain DIVA3 517/6/12" /NCGR_SAMPLE_ID=MMETSP0168 /ASSEMBLY_ACC=CAM_ASM_000044 /LENGTH=319 /DNA_ID=CAMNT_0001823063 /DNA_START=66 /DNA_END=1025 /DNA_ORIENTATION=-
MSLAGANDHDKLANLSLQTYKEQAVWFLNAFWNSFGEENAEKIWAYKHKCDELDLQESENGNGLDEMKAHVFLESFDETLTVREMRNTLRESGALGEKERPKKVPLIHVLVCLFKADWKKCVNASQGDNQEEVEQAQRMLNDVLTALEEVKRSAEAAKQAEAAAKKAEAEAKQAQAELEAALAEVKAQEDAYNSKTEALKAKSETGGIVSRNKAKAELEIHLAEDPLPLRRAKITLEAAVKRSDRATKAAEAATAAAIQARTEAEAAVADAEKKVEEAQAYLDEVKSKPGSAAGALWWIDRELHEARKYMPSSKGGIAK